MTSWRLLLRIVGVLNLALAQFGCYAEAIPTLSMLRNPPLFNPREPFFPAAFWTMAAIDVALLAAFIVVGIMLLRLRRGAAIAQTCLAVVASVYAILPGSLWLLPNGVGASIAGASGVADLGLGLLVIYPIPFLYPLVSIACVNIARYQLKKAGSEATQVARYV
jgi:uncharacterized membrane protein